MADRRATSNRAAKLVISIGLFILEYVWNSIHGLFAKPSGHSGTILYYHAIPANQRELFAKQMDVLVRLARPFKLDSAWEFERGVRYAAVTFDDGFRSVLENALPELESRKIPATIFMTAERLGQTPDWWPQSAQYERKEKILSADELKQLSTDLVTIGSHTINHPFLPSLSDEEAKREISLSRVRLEALLKRKVTLFSFPFGAFNDTLVQHCREAGYDRIFTTLPSTAFRNLQEFVVGRVPVDPTDSLLEFRLKLLGAYRWLPYAFAIKRRVRQRSPGKEFAADK